MISVAGTIYGFATACTLKTSVDLKEIASGSYKHSSAAGQSVEYEAERSRWEMSSNHICDAGVAEGKTLFALMTAGEPVKVSFEQVKKGTVAESKLSGETGTVVSDGDAGFYGTALIESLEFSGDQDGDATYSIVLRGTGPLSTTKPVAG